MKVAFSTQDLQRVDAHFGWAKHLSVYDITTAGYQFIENFDFDGNLDEDGDEDKLTPKLAAIGDCAILYVAAIGGSAAARVVAHKIHPVKVTEAEPILDILDRLLDVVCGTPPPWLRKAMRKDQPGVNFEEDFEGEARND